MPLSLDEWQSFYVITGTASAAPVAAAASAANIEPSSAGAR
jgi:hypothetical protein